MRGKTSRGERSSGLIRVLISISVAMDKMYQILVTSAAPSVFFFQAGRFQLFSRPFNWVRVSKSAKFRVLLLCRALLDGARFNRTSLARAAVGGYFDFVFYATFCNQSDVRAATHNTACDNKRTFLRLHIPLHKLAPAHGGVPKLGYERTELIFGVQVGSRHRSLAHPEGILLRLRRSYRSCIATPNCPTVQLRLLGYSSIIPPAMPINYQADLLDRSTSIPTRFRGVPVTKHQHRFSILPV